jgi:Flp pilus assembly protein TadG
MRGEEGQTTVIMALFLTTFLLGFVALGIDVESLFQAKRRAQSAADAAAVAYAEEYTNGNAAQQAAANAIVKLNGVNTVPVINSPPVYGNYTTTSKNAYYEAIVSVPVSVFFAPLITHQSTITVTGRGVAGAGLTSPSCVCLEGTSGTDLNLSNGAKLSPTSCGTTVDSSSSNAVTITGGSTLGGVAIGSISTNWDTSSNVNNGGSVANGTVVHQGISTSCSPPLPAVPSYSAASCTADPLSKQGGGGATYSVGPGGSSPTINQTGGLVCYNNLTIGSNGDTVTINPGIYVINGGELHFLSARAAGGSGVFFYLTGGASLVVDNGANVTLSAATSGTYSGTLLFQDPADTQALSIQGGSSTNLSGAIYAPSSNVTFGNGSGNMLDDLTAKTLTMNGGALASNASTNFGTLNISTAKLGE